MRSCTRRDLAVRFPAAKNKEKITVLRLVIQITEPWKTRTGSEE